MTFALFFASYPCFNDTSIISRSSIRKQRFYVRKNRKNISLITKKRLPLKTFNQFLGVLFFSYCLLNRIIAVVPTPSILL